MMNTPQILSQGNQQHILLQGKHRFYHKVNTQHMFSQVKLSILSQDTQ